MAAGWGVRAFSDTGYVIIENPLSTQRSRGWKSAVETARNAREEDFVSRAMTHHVTGAAGGCFEFLTEDFHPRLCRGI